VHEWRLDLEGQNCQTFTDVVNALLGFLRVRRASAQAKFPFHSENHSVVGLVWIPPWSAAVLTRSTYIQIDTSFMAIEPHVYSIPLATVLGTSETKELYEMRYHAMHTMGVIHADLDSKPILSEQHASLTAIGQT
jgi:hypothetical protein